VIVLAFWLKKGLNKRMKRWQLAWHLMMMGMSFCLIGPQASALTPGAPDRSFQSSLDSSGEAVRWATSLPGGRVLVGGAFRNLQGVSRDGIARLLPTGQLDPTFNPGRGLNGGDATCYVRQADGKILVAGDFTQFHFTPVGHLMRLNPDGSLDRTFAPTTGANGPITAMALDELDRIWIGGTFTQVNSVPLAGIARLRLDGSLDPTFTPGSGPAGGTINAILPIDGGGAYVGGSFTTFSGNTRGRLARLTSTGAVDGFTPPSGGFSSGSVLALAVDEGGSLLVGGFFSQYAGTNRANLAKISSSAALDTSFNPAPNSTVAKILPRADGGWLIAGQFSQIAGVPKIGLARLDAQGALVPSFGPGSGADQGVLSLEVEPAGTLLASGFFSSWNGARRSGVARLSGTGRLVARFAPRAIASPTAINSLAVQPDGRIIVGGDITSHGGVPREGITRLLRDGGRDPTFRPGRGTNGDVTKLALQADGRILILGMFDEVNGVPRPGLARLLRNGQLDRSFDPGSGFDLRPRALLVTPSGLIYVGGEFGFYQGVAARGLIRLLPNGARDPDFTQGSGVQAGRDVYALALQPDGRLLVGGSFETYNGTAAPFITRLLTTGVVDSTFTPGTGANNSVRVIQYTSTDRILIGGNFNSFNGSTRNGIARLGVNGVLDPTFNSTTTLQSGAQVDDIVFQPDGKVIALGGFTASSGDFNLARLNSNGTLDTSFRTGEGVPQYDEILSGALQADGKLIIGGEATTFDAVPQIAVCRVLTGIDVSRTTFSGAVVPPADNPAPAGSIRVTGSRNRFTAVFRQVGSTTRFRGEFDALGSWSGTVTRADGSDLDITLTVSRDPLGQGGHRLGGTVTLGASVGNVLAYPVFFNARLRPYSQLAGYYTHRIFQTDVTDPNLPHGHGFYSLRQGSSGPARIAGRMSDDSPFTASVNLSPRGGMAFHAPLRGGRGFLNGLALIGVDRNRTTNSANLRWLRSAGGSGAYAAGFYLSVSSFGSIFPLPNGPILDLPLAVNNAKLVVSNGNLPSSNDQNLTIDAQNRVASASGLRIRINPRTGLISGDYRLSGQPGFFPLRGMAVNALGQAPGYLMLPEPGQPLRSSRLQLQPN
jgi:uncharacterized delta-60 repeat protein